MRIKNIAILSTLICALGIGNAQANWQYQKNTNTDSAWYYDDGSRLTLSFRGGAAMGSAGIQNDIGALTVGYWQNPGTGEIVSDLYYSACVTAGGCAGFTDMGTGNIGTLSAANEFSSFSFAGGVGLGWTIPNSPQFRIEAGWDTITESEYNATPLFEGDLTLTGTSTTIPVQSGAGTSTVSTTVISVVGYYDFFDGVEKPLKTFIPYFGIGAGYADSITELILSDLYGDLSSDVDLENYGEPNAYGVLQFEKSTKNSINVAGIGAVGFSYGIMENTYIDFGVRVMYIPKVEWSLVNTETEKERDWFSATDMLYTNFMFGVRFEF